jgi:hypothetical protein
LSSINIVDVGILVEVAGAIWNVINC